MDKQEYFKLNGHDIGFGSYSTEGTIYAGPEALTTVVEIRNGRLNINLISQPIELTKALDNGLYQSDVYQHKRLLEHGIRLTTYFDYEVPDGKYDTVIKCPYSEMSGFEVYGFPGGRNQFFGTIHLQKGTVIINGEIRAQKDDPVIPLEVRKNFQPKKLRAAQGTFTLEEAKKQNPKTQVYQVNFPRGVNENFAEELKEFPNLMEVVITQVGEQSIENLPDNLFVLNQLTALTVKRSYSFNLPEAKRKLTQINPKIIQLDKLEELNISDQQLKNIPDEICSLHELGVIDLNNNQLACLPECIGALPNLKKLYIEGNPFKSLPKSLKNIQEVVADRASQKLYLDLSYHGKNKKPIDQSLFNLKNYTQERKKLEEMMISYGIEEPFKNMVLDYSTMATYLVCRTANKPVKLGHSKLGGSPHLPKGWEHPQNKKGELYLFMGQLNCEELAPYQRYLPRKGMLYFFINDTEYAEKARVLYSEDISDLENFTYDDETHFIDQDFDQSWYDEVAILKFENQISVPNTYGFPYKMQERFPKYIDYMNWADQDDEELEKIDRYNDLLMDLPDEFVPPQYVYNEIFKGDFHSINSNVFTQNELPQEWAAIRFGGEPEDWMVLLNLESIPPFSFWDAGTLTFCVHKKDLAIAAFDKIKATIESA